MVDDSKEKPVSDCTTACPRYRQAELEQFLQVSTRLYRRSPRDRVWLGLYLDTWEIDLQRDGSTEHGIDAVSSRRHTKKACPCQRLRARSREVTRLTTRVRGGLGRRIAALEGQLAMERHSNEGEVG